MKTAYGFFAILTVSMIGGFVGSCHASRVFGDKALATNPCFSEQHAAKKEISND